ncbi:hypothetical protein [Flavisolibacter tropicus]|uniref:Lipoprotein n=1 Tax=Flavisolibacter tropicus TaxID=1492898 RepID=A0A172U125_9BACT|nr:hypothetical protein [Flavisolibacter tropicus]ANE53020.1 hypothetical protein SY85_23640 [Flavisolibacter tropicus]
MNTKKHLKDLFFLLVAGFIVGFACFAIMYWVFRNDYKECLTFAWIAGGAGIIAEYIKPYLPKKRQQS